MTFLCKHGHQHKTLRAVQFCEINTAWNAKADQIIKTPWVLTGTKEVWSDMGEFTMFFWSAMRDWIIIRDKVYQFNPCYDNINMEVHHIIPRRLGGADHPANLITLCHEHHRIQGAHHYNMGLCLNNADIGRTHSRRQGGLVRPETEKTLLDYCLKY